MEYTTVIEVEDAVRLRKDGRCLFVDCRFSLTDTGSGEREYLAAHIPGAVYAHLDNDLSGAIVPGKTGRHPLPRPEVFAQTLSRWGIDSTTQVICYDAAGGDMAAARLWWMLHWMGHGNAAVLNGGWKLWQDHALEQRCGREARAAAEFVPAVRADLVASAADVEAVMFRRDFILIDARAHSTFVGEASAYDPVYGHIPGAVSAPRSENIGPDGCLLPREELRRRFQDILAGVNPRNGIVYCGSGVTAAHDLLALQYSGLIGARLFPGSFSEWITDPARAVEIGETSRR